MPVEFKQFFDSQCSLSKSGHPSKGQGFDFVLEEENKNVKAWLKRGVPTDKVWLTSCRNHQSLKDMRGKVLKLSGHSVEVSEKEINLDEAVVQWRLRLRQTQYINGHKHGSVLTSISADVLDQGLSNFTEESSRKRAYRMMDMLLHQVPPADPTLHHPVYVLQSEREKYSSTDSLTVADIDNKILDVIDSLDDYSQEIYLNIFHKLRSAKKAQHIQFLDEVSGALLEQEPHDDGDTLLRDEETED